MSTPDKELDELFGAIFSDNTAILTDVPEMQELKAAILSKYISRAEVLEMIGEDAQGVEKVDPIDYQNDDYYDDGYNAALAELRQKLGASDE